jgi:hypothetical protein
VVVVRDRTSRRVRVRLVALAGVLAAAPFGLPALAAPGAAVSAGTFEAKLTSDDHYAEGEPSIAVNPKDAKNVIVTFLANTGFGTYGMQNQTAPTARDFEQTIQGCDYVVTHDGGRTWKRGTLPIANFEIDPTRPNCSDTLVLFDKQGVAYVIGSSYQFPTFAAGNGDFRLISSRDGGRTWSKPSVVAPTVLSPDPKPQQWQGARFYDDREFMALDDSTQTLYVTGTQGRVDAYGSAGDVEYLTASQDGGKTWSDGIAVGEASFTSPLSAAFGIVALASAPPNGAPRECACLDFVVSADRAKTLVRHPTRIPAGSLGPLSGAATAADPSRKGHFAVLAIQGDRLAVYRTKNAGRRWMPPSSISVQGRGATKTWIEYSPTGVLGVGWRATNSDGSYGFYGAVSYDSGTTWSVQRISRQDSPTTDPLWVAGDDTSAITLAHSRFYATWGDWRGGGLHTWWGGFATRR